MKKILFLATLMSVALTSCYTSRTYVGDVKPGEPTIKVNDEHVHHLIGGLIPVGNNKIDDSNYIGNRKNYVVKNQLTFLDGFLSIITFGIYTPTTIIFEVPLDEINNAKQEIK